MCVCVYVLWVGGCLFSSLQYSLPLSISQLPHCLQSQPALEIAAVQTSAVAQWTRGNVISNRMLTNTIVIVMLVESVFTRTKFV